METGFSIRQLLPQDEPVLWEMLYHAIFIPDGQAPPPRNIIYEARLRMYARHWGQHPGDLGFVAIDHTDGRAVGAAWLRLFSAVEPGYGFVDEGIPELSIAMLPAYRRRGLGSLLLHELLEAARERFDTVSLSVSVDNPAVRLYQSMGFTTLVEDGVSLTMMKKLR
jgi:ribosomal protein S18 acetylase RimI-like enzyme